MSIFIDFALIWRVSLAFLWGGGLAAFLQFNRLGQFLAAERTWTTVVIGVGIDLAISYPWLGSRSDWFTTAFVIAASSLGVIFRSLYNERREAEVNARSYKVTWGIEDAISLAARVTEGLIKVLEMNNLDTQTIKAISQTVATSHKLAAVLRATRRGEYSQKNGR